MTGSARLVLRSAQDQMNRWGKWGAAPWGRLGPQGVGPARPGRSCGGCHTCCLAEQGTGAALAPWNSEFADPGLRSCRSEAPR